MLEERLPPDAYCGICGRAYHDNDYGHDFKHWLIASVEGMTIEERAELMTLLKPPQEQK